MAVVRGMVSSPKSPWSKQGDLGSDASLPETLLQTPAPDIRDPTVISEDAKTMSLRGDYAVTPIRSRRARNLEAGPYSTDNRTLRRSHGTRRRHTHSDRWSHANSVRSDIPPVNWMDNRDLRNPRPGSGPRRRPRDEVKYVGIDRDTGMAFVETRSGARQVLGEQPYRNRDMSHPRRRSKVRTVTLDGSIDNDPGRYAPEWNYVDDPTVRSEYRQPVREYRPIRHYRPVPPPPPPPPPPRTPTRQLSDITVKGSTGGQTVSDDSLENFKGSDMEPRKPKTREFVPHWGHYVETPPSPGQSVKPRQGSVLDPHYRPRSRALDRDLLSPRSFSQSMRPTHGSTLTCPSENGSVKQEQSDESGFHEPVVNRNPEPAIIRHQEPAYAPARNYAAPVVYNPPVQRAAPPNPAPQKGGYQYQRPPPLPPKEEEVRYTTDIEPDPGPRQCDPRYFCTLSGILKIVQFITSVVIIGLSRADTGVWSFHLVALFVGVCGVLLSLGSFFFRLFRWETSAHIGCLWFEFSCYLVISILMLVAAILATLSAGSAPSIVALTVFCFLGAGVFFADAVLIGAAMAKRARAPNTQRDVYPEQGGYPGQGNYQNQDGNPGQGGYPGQDGYPGQGGNTGQGGYPGQGRNLGQGGYPRRGGYIQPGGGGYPGPQPGGGGYPGPQQGDGGYPGGPYNGPYNRQY